MNIDKQKRKDRKRKHEEHDEPEEEIQYIVPENKNRAFNEKARAEEEVLMKDLFGDNSGFIEGLEDVELFPSTSGAADSGVGETEPEDDMSSDDVKGKAAWHDEDDDGIDVGTALEAQNRKLVDGGVNSRSAKYSNLLKHKFSSLHGTPKWAKLNKPATEDDSDEELLQTCGHLVKSESRSLPANILEFKYMQNLNSETYNEGPVITSIEFHPTSTVALVAGVSGVMSLFAVNGNKKNKLHSTSFTKYPIECARFLHDGTEVLLGSRYSHIFTYDLMSAQANRIKLPSSMTQCKKFDVSPCKKFIAVMGKWGEVHLLTTASKELIATLKQNSDVTALTFNANGSLLYGHGSEGEVTVWDMNTRRVKHKWIDEGCLKGTTITVSPSGQLIAAGSAQGVVNLYDVETVLNQKNPKPRKTVMNLTTSITDLHFNSSSEILGLVSSEINSAVRLLHISSGTVFSNFPPWGNNVGRTGVFSFSPNSGYAAFGNRNSTVALYRLKHYSNY